MKGARGARGFSLVELMIAMVLGLLVIGGTVTVFGGASRSSRLNEALSTLQSNARFALDTLTDDLRMAGFRGCADPNAAALAISADGAPTTNLEATAVTGWLVGASASAWTPSAPPGWMPPVTGTSGAPVPGTHALRVQYAALPGYPLASSMTGRTAALAVPGPVDDLRPGDFAIVANCNAAELFEVDGITGGTGGSAASVQPEQRLGQIWRRTGSPDSTSRLMPFVDALYYVGDTGRENESGDAVRALYLQTFPHVATNPPLELVDGVDQMRFEFGGAASATRTAFRRPGTTGLPAADVRVVRVGLLMTSRERFPEHGSGPAVRLAGEAVLPAGASVPAGTPTYPADARLRVAFDTTVSIRNRGVQTGP